MRDADGQLITCHECDALFLRHEIPAGARADCTRCGAELYRHIPQSLERSSALYLSTLIFMVIANVYPFLGMKTAGLSEENLIYSGGWALYEFGMGELGFVVFLTSILFPFLSVAGMLLLLIPLQFGFLPIGHRIVYRIVRVCEPWSLLSVFMLGTLVAIVKLQSLATVVPGLGLVGFVAMLITYSAARVSFDPEVLWQKSAVRQLNKISATANEAILTCHTCGLIRPNRESYYHCERCGSPVHYRITDSVQRTWALLIAAALMLIPANLYPVMTITMLGKGAPDTIFTGIVKLISSGLWGLALIVLFASIVVPFLKLTALSYLLYSVSSKSKWRPRDRTLLYRMTELVGAWSMVDVFLVGLLSGLVSLGLIATVVPGIGATFFGGAVILTMLAAKSFDPRLIWDGALQSSEEVILKSDEGIQVTP
ncbi:MAG: paraquat-inducible protein A [Pseudomonadales bacterium]|nr:paraquat-inducible protein A [Pseudomonadales bacterium]MDP7576293.1 paraquat-inducible protein A [Pseudomonadales bacterium]